MRRLALRRTARIARRVVTLNQPPSPLAEQAHAQTRDAVFDLAGREFRTTRSLPLKKPLWQWWLE